MKNAVMYVLYTSIVTVCVIVVISTYITSKNNITYYLQNKCELISNHAGTSYWYECDKTTTNPGIKN